MSTQLEWRRVSDMRKASTCGRYVIDRHPNYAQHPAMTYEYVAKLTNMQADPLGTFTSFELAAARCDEDLKSKTTAKGQST